MTWQERERHRLALQYLERAKKHSETMKRKREYDREQLEKQRQHSQDQSRGYLNNESGINHSRE